MRTQGEREAELGRVVSQFLREAFGRGPVSTRAFLLDGLAVVALRGVLIAPETRLAGSADPADEALVREPRRKVLRRGTADLTAAAGAALGLTVRAVLSDVDPTADEAVFVFTVGAGERSIQSLK